ncbi:MAG TPA: 3-keto-5-aminohexanoate cleavage protein, partial [Terriglobales bacterium]|nr:3-keto-5-aminohexanoate cleavage protein [Terriglobales bacterium]
EAFEIGITIAHIHAREEDGTPTWRPEIYYEIFQGIRKHCPGLVICGSTSGRNFPEFEKRSAVIELQPDMCSLTLSSLNFVDQASVNSPAMIQQLAAKMAEYGVHPEMECFDLGMINYGHYLIKKGFVSAPVYWNLIFGNIAGAQATAAQMGALLNELRGHDLVACGGIGDSQLRANAIAIALGIGVRVGIEDNIYWDAERTRLASNGDLLKRVHELIAAHGHTPMTAQDFGKRGFYNAKHLSWV